MLRRGEDNDADISEPERAASARTSQSSRRGADARNETATKPRVLVRLRRSPCWRNCGLLERRSAGHAYGLSLARRGTASVERGHVERYRLGVLGSSFLLRESRGPAQRRYVLGIQCQRLVESKFRLGKMPELRVQGPDLRKAHEVLFIQSRRPLKGGERLCGARHGQIDLSEVLPQRPVIGREFRGFRRGVQCFGELAQLGVADAERFPRLRIEWLLARPFRGVDDEKIPIAFLLERLNS